jgi:hypothetical protein
MAWRLQGGVAGQVHEVEQRERGVRFPAGGGHRDYYAEQAGEE